MSLIGLRPEDRGPDGYTYAAVLVRTSEDEATHHDVLDRLRGLRFTGWLAPPQPGWTVAVASGEGTVAAGRRGVIGVGEALAEGRTGTVVALRVRSDRQLAVVAWTGGEEVCRYVSDPSVEPGADDDVLDEPFGVHTAEALAAACGHPEAGEKLRELLAPGLDDDEIESERLNRLLELLGMPTWLVTAWRLPRSMSTGPSPRSFTHLGAGLTGPLGWLGRTLTARVRRWRPPPPVVADPPKGYGDLDDPMLWL